MGNDRIRMAGLFAAVSVVVGACNLGLDQVELGDRGTPFVLKGTTAIINDGGPCLVWRGENGASYHLFQHPTLENEAFDQVIEPGVTSRLVLITRSDLTLDCQIGAIVEVQDVLEIVD